MTTTSLPRLARSYSRKYGPRPALIEQARGERVEFSWLDLWNGAVGVASDLARADLPHEAMVAIVAPTTAGAVMAEVGAMAARCVACPLDPSMDDPTLAALLARAAPRVVFATQSERPRVERCLAGSEARVLPLPEARPGHTSQPDIGADLEARLESSGPGGHAMSLPVLGREATLVDFLHRTLTGTAAALASALRAVEGDTWWSPGPLGAPWGRVAGLYTPLVSGGEVVLPDPGPPQDPLAPFWLHRPSIAVVTASDLPVLASRAREEAKAVAGLSGWLARVALRWDGVLGPEVPPLPRRPWWREAARAGRARLQDILGGRLRVVVCDRSPTDPEASRLLRAMGAVVVASFGPPEAAGLVAVERPGEATPPGSVGRILDGVLVETAADGEVLVSGHAVMLSHRKVRPDENPMFRDGWLRTGVSGRVDERGWLYLDGPGKQST